MKPENATAAAERRLGGVIKYQFYKVLHIPFNLPRQTQSSSPYCQSKVRFTSLKKVLLCSCR